MKNEGISLNVRLLAILVACGVVFCVFVFFLHYFQVQRQSRFFLNEARAGLEELNAAEDPLEKAEKAEDISSLYRRYLIQNEDDSEVEEEYASMCYDTARYLYESSLKEKNQDKRRKSRRYSAVLYGASISHLEKALRKNTEQPQIRAKLVDILYKTGNWSDAIDNVKFLCESPDNAAALGKLFDRYDLWKRISPPPPADQAADVSLEKFISDVDKTVDREKLLDFLGDDLWMILEDPELLATYAGCQAAQDKKAEAEKALKKAVTISPEEPKYYESLAYLLMSMNPPRDADADYWMNEMVYANAESFDAKLRRGRYWNRIAREREKDQQKQLAKSAVYDALGAMQKAITVIADEADRQAPTLPQTKALKEALENLPEKPPASEQNLPSGYRRALLDANKAALALSGKIDGISAEIEACRDGLLLAAQSEWLVNWLINGDSGDASNGAGEDGLQNSRLYAESLTSLYPDFSPGYSALSEIYLQAGDRDKAIAALRKGSDVCEDNAALLWRLAFLLIDGNDIKSAKTVCRRLEEEGTSEEYAVKHLKARIAFSEGRWLEAAKGFEAVRDEVADRWPSRMKSLDYLLAECYGRLGRLDQQRDAYFRAASSDRTWLPALLGIAKTKAQTGEIDGAIEDYRLILKLHNSPTSAAFELARLLIFKNLQKPQAERNWKEASEVVLSLEKAKADPLQALLLKADIYEAQGLDEKASDILQEAQKKFEAEEKFLQTQLAEAKNKVEALSGKDKEQALAELEQLMSAVKKNAAEQAAIWSAIVKSAKRKNNWKLAEKAIMSARGKVGDTVPMRLSQGEFILDRIGDKAAEPLRSLAGNTARFSKPARLQLWQGLAGLSLRAGDHEQAKLLSRSVLKEEPGNRRMQLIRFEIAIIEKDLEVMEEVLDEVEKSENTPGSFWHYGQAIKLNIQAENADTKLLNQAQSHLAEALRIRPNWPAARLLSATIHDRQGNMEAAVESYRKAIDLGVKSTSVIRRTVQLLAGLNRFREADEILRLLGERQDTVDGEADFESSIIKAHMGQYDDAVVLSRKAAKESKKASDHVWLGQLLSIVGRQAENQKRAEDAKKSLDEAEKAFQKAVALEPGSDVAWVALIQFYGQTGQMQKAEAAIEKAQEKLPPEKAAVAIVQCYEAIGKKQDAEKQLLENAAASPQDAAAVERLADYYVRNHQNEKAAAQLDKILEGDAKASSDQKCKARRLYATILFQQGGEENRKKALEYIESNLRLNADSHADQYAKAVLLANDLSAEQRKKAIPVMEKLLDAQRSPSAEIQFTLAKLYLSEQKLPDFKNIMRNVLRGERKEPRYLAFYIEALIDHNDSKEAGVYLELLKKDLPDDFATCKLEAKLAFAQKNYETTIKALKEFLDADRGNEENHMLHMAEAAAMLAGFADTLKEKSGSYNPIAKGFDDEAESIFQQFADTQPGRELLMAQFLARQGRLAKAIRMTKDSSETASPEEIAQTCFAFLQGASPSAEQLRQIDRILQDSHAKYEKDKNATILKIAMAILRDFQGRDSETEAIYRDILETDPGNPTAMNNLALFLALHNRNLDEAVGLVNKAIEDNGRLPGLLDTRAVVYLAQQKPKKALDDLSLALNKQPTAVRFFHQAQAYFLDGQQNAAVKALQTAHDFGLKEESLVGIERRKYQKLIRDLR